MHMATLHICSSTSTLFRTNTCSTATLQHINCPTSHFALICLSLLATVLLQMDVANSLTGAAQNVRQQRPCTLDKPTQALVKLIFDKDMFSSAMASFEIGGWKQSNWESSNTTILNIYAMICFVLTDDHSLFTVFTIYSQTWRSFPWGRSARAKSQRWRLRKFILLPLPPPPPLPLPPPPPPPPHLPPPPLSPNLSHRLRMIRFLGLWGSGGDRARAKRLEGKLGRTVRPLLHNHSSWLR